MYLPSEDKYNEGKKEKLDRLVVIMGGRVAEEIVFGDVTSGAYGDIRQATHEPDARSMICQLGMSEKLGMVNYGETDEPVFLGRDMGRTRDYSEATAQEIDREVKQLLRRCLPEGHRHHQQEPRKARCHRQIVAGVRDTQWQSSDGTHRNGSDAKPAEDRSHLRRPRCRHR